MGVMKKSDSDVEGKEKKNNGIKKHEVIVTGVYIHKFNHKTVKQEYSPIDRGLVPNPQCVATRWSE